LAKPLRALVTVNPFRQRAANVITEATLKRLPLPTLLITGEADLYSPPALIRMVAAQIPNSEVVIVREAGHSSFWVKPNVSQEGAVPASNDYDANFEFGVL
jgi:pimeloyl-ACP methyl ester carboxylesterase